MKMKSWYGPLLIGVVVGVFTMIGSIIASSIKEHSSIRGTMGPGPGDGMPGMFMPYTCNAVSCSNGVFVLDYGKLIKINKTSLERIGEIKLSQGYTTIMGDKIYKVANNANGIERILVFQLSKMLVIDTASCKVLRTIALPVVPSPSRGMQQGGKIAVGPSPYSFVDEPVVKNNDVVYLVCGPSIAAVNFESGEITVARDALIPGRP